MKKSQLLQLLSAVAMPICYLLFVVADHTGLWDKYLGLDLVEDVAERLETSYAEVDRTIGSDEPAWKPLLALIDRYSIAELPDDKEPKVLARLVAVSSSKIELGEGKIAEWTAPTTPITLIYRDWPGQTVPPEDYRIVGTIGDIRDWIEMRRADYRFLIQDILLGLFSVVLAIVVWFGDFQKDTDSPNLADARQNVEKKKKIGGT